MITENYVNFDIAKLLKEKGFNDVPVYTYYLNYGGFYMSPMAVTNKDLYAQGHIAAPTLQMTMKWLREVHDIYIDISIYVITKNILKYNINVYYKKHKNDSMYLGIHLTKECSKYEDAVEVALKYTLENLI